jgi:hypothetical protein
MKYKDNVGEIIPGVLAKSLSILALKSRRVILFAVTDYSAIEGSAATTLAKGVGWTSRASSKIYETSAALTYRSEAKAQPPRTPLALSWWIKSGPLKTMGGRAMGLNDAGDEKHRRPLAQSPPVVKSVVQPNCAIKYTMKTYLFRPKVSFCQSLSIKA